MKANRSPWFPMAATLSCLTGSSIAQLMSQIPSFSLSIVRAPLLLLYGVLPQTICFSGFALLCLRREHSCNSAPIDHLADVPCYIRAVCLLVAVMPLPA